MKSQKFIAIGLSVILLSSIAAFSNADDVDDIEEVTETESTVEEVSEENIPEDIATTDIEETYSEGEDTSEPEISEEIVESEEQVVEDISDEIDEPELIEETEITETAVEENVDTEEIEATEETYVETEEVISNANAQEILDCISYDFASEEYIGHEALQDVVVYYYAWREANIYMNPDSTSEVINTVSYGDAVKLIDFAYTSPWWTIEFNGSVGYINALAITWADAEYMNNHPDFVSELEAIYVEDKPLEEQCALAYGIPEIE